MGVVGAVTMSATTFACNTQRTREPIRFANVVGKSVGDGTDPVSLSDFMNHWFDPSLSWRDIEWFRDQWEGSIVLKGIQSVADAVTAADFGVEAIALSNHGGRQLDGAPPSIDLVAPVTEGSRTGQRSTATVGCAGVGTSSMRLPWEREHAWRAGHIYMVGVRPARSASMRSCTRWTRSPPWSR